MSDPDRKQQFRFTLTGAGIAAIVASIIPVIVLFRGEPTAEHVAERSDQENQRLFENQGKIRNRLIAVESKLEVLEKVCVQRPVVPALVEKPKKAKKVLERKISTPVIGLGSLRTLGRGGGGGGNASVSAVTPPRCRAGWVLEDGKCVKLRTALDLKAKKLEAERREKRKILEQAKRAILERKRAEKRAKRQMQQQQQLAPPAPLLRK